MGYYLIPHEIAESTVSLGHGLCGSGGSIYNKDTTQTVISSPLLVLTMIDPEIDHRFKAIRNTNRTTMQTTPCRIVFGRDKIHSIAFRGNWD
jgi:hypothetical protein